MRESNVSLSVMPQNWTKDAEALISTGAKMIDVDTVKGLLGVIHALQDERDRLESMLDRAYRELDRLE